MEFYSLVNPIALAWVVVVFITVQSRVRSDKIFHRKDSSTRVIQGQDSSLQGLYMGLVVACLIDWLVEQFVVVDAGSDF